MNDPFFVGWASRIPRPLALFLVAALVPALAGFVLLGLAIAASVDDPGGGSFDWAGGVQARQGVLTASPYPLLRLAPDAAHPRGHTILLSGLGKEGLAVDPATMEGRVVEASGLLIKRGSIDMLQVDPHDGLRVLGLLAAPATPPTPLGRWRIAGEICDGKCYTGAMRPGSGLAHKACASLCLIGGIPPVFVSTGPVEGDSFFLLAGPDGSAMPEALRRLIAVRVQLEGEVERRGDLLVFRADPASARVR